MMHDSSEPGNTDASPDEWEDDGTEYQLDPDEEFKPRPTQTSELPEDINDSWWRNFREQSGLSRQYSIADILIATFFAAIVLTLLRLFPPAYVAAVMGIAVLAGLGLMSTDAPRPRYFLLAWWMLLLLYISISIMAMVSGAERL